MITKRISILAFILIILVSTGFSGDLSKESFKKEFRGLRSQNDLNDLCVRYIEGTDDIDLIRHVQNRWNRKNTRDALTYFSNQFESNPESAKYAYLFVESRILPLAGRLLNWTKSSLMVTD